MLRGIAAQLLPTLLEYRPSHAISLRYRQAYLLPRSLTRLRSITPLFHPAVFRFPRLLHYGASLWLLFSRLLERFRQLTSQ